MDNNAFGLYAILTDPVVGYEECARIIVGEGIRFLQLRMKNEPRGKIIAMAHHIREITRHTDTLFIINDDIRLAIEVNADGVHLGQDDMPVFEAKEIWGQSEKIFGVSTHNVFQARIAQGMVATYIGVGPVFPTPAKEKPDPVLGLVGMKNILSKITIPAIAIGGITKENLPQVLAHNAINFSAVRPINQSTNPGVEIRELMGTWKRFARRNTNEIS